MGLEEALDSTGFWILAGGGIAMELIGFMASKKMGMGSLPVWQLIVLMIGTIIASAFFATRD